MPWTRSDRGEGEALALWLLDLEAQLDQSADGFGSQMPIGHVARRAALRGLGQNIRFVIFINAGRRILWWKGP